MNKFQFRFLDNWQYASKAVVRDQTGGSYDQRCSFPFTFQNEEQTSCIEAQTGDWCFYLTDDQNNGVPGQTGICDPSDVPRGE